jgi:RNA polymerase-binding transcription factor DksA
MANPRKTSAARLKAAGRGPKPAKAAKKTTATPSLKRPAASAPKPAAGSARGKDVKPTKDKGAKPRPGAGAPQVAGRRGDRPTGARRGVAGAAPPEVRPLGVLPPSSMARTTPKPAVVPPSPPRSVTPRHEIASTPTSGEQRVTEQDLKEFEERLLQERQKILKEMGHLENTVLKINQRDSAGDLSGYSFHMADVGTDSMEREKAFLFASAEGRTLLEITEALRRVYRGEYGTCESCGRPIARARLQAMPHARLCVSCKEKEERAGRGAM